MTSQVVQQRGRWFAFGAAGVLALLIAGCGGGETGPIGNAAMQSTSGGTTGAPLVDGKTAPLGAGGAPTQSPIVASKFPGQAQAPICTAACLNTQLDCAP